MASIPGEDHVYVTLHCMVFPVFCLVLSILLVVAGVDVGETLAIEETRKKLKKKSKRGVYRPKIQIDLVFKRRTVQAPAKTEKATLKKYTRKNKVGKRVEDVGDGGEDDLILGGENNSMVVGVGGGKIEGVEVSCMEGVFLAGESYVPFPEIGGEVAVKKAEEDREEMGIGDCTPPPAPQALERKFQKTYQRRRGLNVKRCLDFGSGLKGIELEHACESLEKFEFPVGKFTGEMIVGEGGKEQEAMVASNFNHVVFTRKPRTKRARKAGLVKPFSAHPREWSFLLSRENLKTVLTKSGRCNGKSRRDDLLLVNVLRKKRTLRGKRREMSKILGELGFAEKKKSRAICCRVSINDHLSALVPRKQRTYKSKERATNEEPSEEIKMQMPNFEIESSNNFHFPMSSLAEQIGRPLVVPNLLEGAVSLSGLAKESNGPLVEKGMVVNNTRIFL